MSAREPVRFFTVLAELVAELVYGLVHHGHGAS